jgi:hypothetical protein
LVREVVTKHTRVSTLMYLVDVRGAAPLSCCREPIRLLWAGKVLDEGQTLGSYNIGHDATLHQIGRLGAQQWSPRDWGELKEKYVWHAHRCHPLLVGDRRCSACTVLTRKHCASESAPTPHRRRSHSRS